MELGFATATYTATVHGPMAQQVAGDDTTGIINEWVVGACGSANKFPFVPLLLLRSWDVNLGQLVESSYDVLRNRKLLVILNQLKVRFPQL